VEVFSFKCINSCNTLEQKLVLIMHIGKDIVVTHHAMMYLELTWEVFERQVRIVEVT